MAEYSLNTLVWGTILTIWLVSSITVYDLYLENHTYTKLTQLQEINKGVQINYLTHLKDIYSFLSNMANDDFWFKIVTYKSLTDLKNLWLYNLNKYKQGEKFIIIINPSLDNWKDVTNTFKNKDWNTIYSKYPADDIQVYSLWFYKTFYNLTRVY